MKVKPNINKTCPYCKKDFISHNKSAIYCSKLCRNRTNQNIKNPLTTPRICKVCKKEFIVTKHQCNKQHCSDECSRKSAQLSRKRFTDKNPKRHLIYNDTRRKKGHQDTLINRFFTKYPKVKKQCIVCGESRILDLHHIKKRNGSWRLMSNTTPDNIWVLCPTCHALIERGICTPKELGICE